MNYKQAKIADSAKVAKETVLVGNITIGEESTVLFFTAMRCEGEESIVIGNQSNIQENCTIHVDEGNSVKIGDGVTVGHNSVIHGSYNFPVYYSDFRLQWTLLLHSALL